MKSTYIKMAIIGLIGLCFAATAQPIKERGLSRGAAVPDMNFNLLNSSREKVQLSDFKGKLVILDFWTTTCTGCIQQFPKLDSLQQVFGDKIKIFLVNSLHNRIGESREKIDNFFKRRKEQGKRFGLETAVEDTLAVHLFPHLMIPHYVWIDQQGRFIATTSSEQVTAQHIQSLLEGKLIQMRQKIDRTDFDINISLFSNENGGSERNVIYKSTLTGYLDGVPQASVGLLAKEKINRLCMTNYSLLMIYKRLFNNRFLSNRFVIDPKYLARFKVPDTTEFESWKYDNMYCYELITRPSPKDSLLLQMGKDLKERLGFSASIEQKSTKCFVIRLKEQQEKNKQLVVDASTVMEFKGSSADLRTSLDWNLPLPVVDETGYKDKFTLKLPKNLKDISGLNRMLNQQGLDLVEAERELEVVVISKVE